MRVHVCFCVYPQAIKTWITDLAIPTAFQFACMVLTIDIIDGHGLSNKVHC